MSDYYSDSWEGEAGDWTPNDDDTSLLKQLGIEFVTPKYWRSNGYSRDHAFCLMPYLQQLILSKTRDVMNGDYKLQAYEKKRYDAKITILHWLRKNGRIENHKPELRVVIPHDDALMPMWRALAGAIHNNTSERFQLDFTGVELTEELLQVIFESFGGKQVITALFRSANLTKEALGSILKFAAARPKLSGLYLDQNEIIGDLLGSVVGLQHVTSLHVTRCKINAEGAKILGQFLQLDPALMKELDISRNPIGDDGAQSLAPGLQANTNLTLLRMRNIALTTVGHAHFATALMDSSSLAAMIASNHSCWMCYDGSDNGGAILDEIYDELLDGRVCSTSALNYAVGCYCYNVQDEPYVTPANSAARKILFAIREDVQRCPMYFVDLGLGVLPRLLRLIQLTPLSIQKSHGPYWSPTPSPKIVGDRRVLSSVFETLKCCFVPQLGASGHRLSKRKRDD